jgi:hypothetical protein
MNLLRRALQLYSDLTVNIVLYHLADWEPGNMPWQVHLLAVNTLLNPLPIVDDMPDIEKPSEKYC